MTDIIYKKRKKEKVYINVKKKNFKWYIMHHGNIRCTSFKNTLKLIKK